ncbi:glycosyltransferase family 2 protein [Paracoccus sp. MBLB3053]|uniref:Glycosyltransferase family 2 protein n=1 Tax=Paracoccus aurantius TaxID=3073814 RepID=A0ABU2HYF3_9RHOB|nr:glycosyltransferase family 2 protein [Paracoccus sp. MBLB3053]MDS9470061.1 glycosyltransferase family 2 protein [Paracoccus sp. MBLB3053]
MSDLIGTGDHGRSANDPEIASVTTDECDPRCAVAEELRHPLTISVVMPAYQAATMLPHSLSPLMALVASGEVLEVFVVDDGSSDMTALVAGSLGANVLRLERNSGPAAARNHALPWVSGDLVWFVDSDVVINEGGPDLIRRAFAEPTLGAIFGCYDDDPADPHWFSRYKNLMHRYYHLRAPREVHSFWSGCGVVRRSVLQELGGFDALRYPRAMIEDIELGYRISQAGHRIEIEPQLTGKHLKAWRMAMSLRLDIFDRAIPWARLLIAEEGPAGELNVGSAERFRAGFAVLSLLLLLGAVFAQVPAYLAFAAIGASLLFNVRLGLFLLRHGGLPVAIGGMLYHQFYYLYASGAYLWCLVDLRLLHRGDRFKAVRMRQDEHSGQDAGAISQSERMRS